ncbi:MAG: helix-turn-helix transcriptional regulator [Hespellia sp.]|nr:helix-turn-helix transcriptional regulator [Hespellia sp.]
MAINYENLGERISKLRGNKKLSQEELASIINVTRETLARLETAKRKPSLDTIVEIANALEVSVDDLLVDSLKHSSSTADTELHKLLLECNQVEEEILVELVKHMKPVLYRLGI